MILSDHTINEYLADGRIVVSPLGDGCVQPASIDVRLDKHIPGVPQLAPAVTSTCGRT